MNVSIRAMSWATRFFWLLALAVTITCVYSVTLIQIGFGEPMINLTEEHLSITLPITIGNEGYYIIAGLNVTTLLLDNETNQISEATTYVSQIPPQNNATILHNISLPLDEIMTNMIYLFDDSNFTLLGSAQLNYANLVPFSLETNTTIPWGAPLYDFATGDPTVNIYNITHLGVMVPINFENHSPYFSVTGVIRVELINSAYQVIGEGTVSMDVPPGANYNGQLEAIINTTLISSVEQVQILVETAMFNYGPIVIDYD